MNVDLGLRQGFRLGDVEIDPVHHEVRARDGTHPLPDRAAAFLMVLAEAPRQVVQASTLHKRLSQELPVDLSSCLREVQEALGDNAESPRYVDEAGTEGFQLLVDVILDFPPVPTTSQIVSRQGKWK